MKAWHQRVFLRIFDRYLKFLIWRRFNKFHIQMSEDARTETSLSSEKMPVLLVANHCSWWDGFFLFRLYRQIAPHGTLYTVMLASELRKHPWLKKVGAIGIDPKNPISVARAFYKLKKLTQEQAGPVFIAYFPQGEIRPQFEPSLNFKPGIELLIKILRPLQIVPVGLGIEPLNASKPLGYVLVGQPLLVDSDSTVPAKSLEIHVESLLETERHEMVRRYLAANAAP